MPDETARSQPKCEHCGKKIRRLAGVWIHDDNGDTHCPDTTTREERHPTASPRDEIR